jgi:hypothetical protein
MARSSLFMSADWRNAFVRNLNITTFVDADLRDGSSTGQLAADSFLSPVCTIGGLVDFDYGRARSNFGSLPRDVSVLLKLTRYFQ